MGELSSLVPSAYTTLHKEVWGSCRVLSILSWKQTALQVELGRKRGMKVGAHNVLLGGVRAEEKR
jgi:hypothetical protein